MISATIAMTAMAGLFVLFGLLATADRRDCDGACGGCARDCEQQTKGNH